MAFEFQPRDGESFIERVSREATERWLYIVANPTEFSASQVGDATNSLNDSRMLEVRDILRYG